MTKIYDRLDEIEDTVMSELKDFQRVTVDRIDYLYRNGQKRILVSDEVGLGKTLVARGTIAKFANLRKEEGDDLVKVVYICSNATIADQNLDKLRIVNEIRAEDTHTSRLSMQHLNIFKQENDENVLNRYIQLIPLTPQTSFNTSYSQGTINERALIYTILKRVPEFQEYSKQLERIFRFGTKYWFDSKRYFEKEFTNVNKKSKGEYERYMVKELSYILKNSKPTQDRILSNPNYQSETILEDLLNLCERIKRYGFEKSESKPFIVELRQIFANISLNKLDPDLIIMDEFQRFRYLLNNDKDSEMGKLTSKFFNSDDVRILMLSATPYKMYSTLDEIDEEEIDAHFSEFFDVLDFLNVCPKERIKFRDVWNNYSIKLKEFEMDKTSFILAKTKAENALFKNICRTERITENNLSDIIDDSDVKNSLNVLEEDILSYIEIQKLLDEIGLGINVPIDYVKSSPYLMSFMKNYKLKRRIEKYFEKYPENISKMKKDTFWLNEDDIDNYNEISYNNARLNHLMGYVLKNNASKLLWVPPSKPYYPLEGVFKGINDFSKTLIFSSWEMVPRMISSMVSYEIERETVGKLISPNREINYFSENRYPSSRLNFNLRDGIPAQMNLFTLIYPSNFLINVYNPIDCLNRNLSLEEIENEIKEKIKEELDKFPSGDSSREDSSWYYLAPLLLDSISSGYYANSWFNQIDNLISNKVFNQKGIIEHFRKLKQQFGICSVNSSVLGKKPDDLLNVLCDMAIASPAICIYRSYEKEKALKRLTINDLVKKGLIGDIFVEKGCIIDDFINPDLIERNLSRRGLSMHNHIARNELDKNLALNGISKEELFVKEPMISYIGFTTQVARKFLSIMNSPESIAVIDLIYKEESEEAYWRNLLKYSKQGNLQAVFDEYVHLLSNGLDENNENRIAIINKKLLKSIDLRTASYDIDTFNSFKSRMLGNDKDVNYLRTHFAVAFTKGRTDDSDANRKKSVRDAFNSPFRPFVLASTSIGQEGLDFHNYCRRIVHWNLPSNPIDLEQREGRINRFECLAIRQNLAKRYDGLEFKTNNIWLELFDEASRVEKTGNCSDLIPYWGLKESDDMVKIERIVPMYPFSKDELRYDRLIKILSLYRLTLGQARQEELIESIFTHSLENKELMENINELFINLSPYYKEETEDFEIDCEDIIIFNENEEEIKTEKSDLKDFHKSDEEINKDDEFILEVLETYDDENFGSYELNEELDNGEDSNFNENINFKEELGDGEDMDIKLKYCFNCGAELVIKGSKFCYNCGQDLRVENLDLNSNELKDVSSTVILSNGSNRIESKNSAAKLQKSFEDIQEISDLKDYWAKIRQIIIENNLFNGNFIKCNDFIYWMPINEIPLNLARIEMLVNNGSIETKLYIHWDKNLYSFLENKKDSIERDIGSGCVFFTRGNVKASRISIYENIDLKDMNFAKEAMIWHISMAKRFYDVCSNLIEEYYSKNPVKFNHFRAKYWEEVDVRLNKTDLLTMDVAHEWGNFPFILKNFGWNEARLELKAYTNHKQIKIWLACNKDIFNYLLLQKKDIEDEMGFALNWKEGKWLSNISVTHYVTIRDRNNWEDAIKWHVDMVDKFKKVFIPRINDFYDRRS